MRTAWDIASIVTTPHIPSRPGKHWRIRSDDNEQHLLVKHIFLHPLYDPRTFENDVALVELLDSPKLNDFVMPVCLPEGASEQGNASQAMTMPLQSSLCLYWDFPTSAGAN